jgi:hypothetical protein
VKKKPMFVTDHGDYIVDTWDDVFTLQLAFTKQQLDMARCNLVNIALDVRRKEGMFRDLMFIREEQEEHDQIKFFRFIFAKWDSVVFLPKRLEE